MRLPITGAHSRANTGAFTAAAAATTPAATSCSTAPRPPASVAVFSVAVSVHQPLSAVRSEVSLPIAISLRIVGLGVERSHHPRARLLPYRVRWARARTTRVCRRTGQERAEIARPFLPRPAIWPRRCGR